MYLNFSRLWIIALLLFAHLWASENAIDYSHLQYLDSQEDSYDVELQQHLELWESLKDEDEDMLGLGKPYKKYEFIQDYTNYLSKPPLFYEQFRNRLYGRMPTP